MLNKKSILSVGVIGVFTLYAIHLRTDVEEHPVVAIKPQPTSAASIIPSPIATSTIGPIPTPAPILTPIPTAVPTQKPAGKYKDGTYTGSVADAFYGNIQVKAVIVDGRITDVIFLQYPNDRGTSIEINRQAMPLLKQEAIEVQSAKVSGVSGATASSDAFIQSLDSALKQAV